MGKMSELLKWSRAANASAKWATFGKHPDEGGVKQTEMNVTGNRILR